MAFLEGLRMNNIFPGNQSLGLGKFTIPKPAVDPFYEAINQYENRLDDSPPSPPMPMSTGALSKVGESIVAPKPPQNVVFKDELTPYQQASLNLRSRELESRQGNAAANRELAAKRISIAEFKAQNPNLRFITPKGGNIIGINPLTGEQFDTGIDSGTLTDAEKAELTSERQMEGIRARSEATEKLEGTRQTNRLSLAEMAAKNAKDLEEARQSNRIELKGTPTPNQPLLPSQEANAIENRIKEVIARNPEWGNYIDRQTGAVKPAGSGSMMGFREGLTEELRNKIVEAIYGNTPPPPSTPPPTTPMPEARIKVIAPNGQSGSWPANKPLPPGYKKVQ